MESEPRQTYNYNDFILTRVNKVREIYHRVREHLQQYSQDFNKQQNKRARTIKMQPDDIVMVKLHTPVGNSNKLSPQFKGPSLRVASVKVTVTATHLQATAKVPPSLQ